MPAVVRRITGRRLQERRARWREAHPLCVRCFAAKPQRIRPWTELDHIVPLHAGGRDDESNLQGLCADCHDEKTREDMHYTKDRPIAVGIDGFPVAQDELRQRREAAEIALNAPCTPPDAA